VSLQRIQSLSVLFVIFALSLLATSQAQTFSATSTPMNEARWGHQATQLPNGEALITGGQVKGFVITGPGSAEIYNPSLGTEGGFTPTINGLNTPRSGHVAVALNNGQVLIVDGTDQNENVIDNAELFTPSTGTFTTLPNKPVFSDDYLASLLPNGSVLLIGSSAEIYNPTTSTFTSLGTQPIADVQTATALGDGRVLLIGQINAATFSPTTQTFTAVGSLTIPRLAHADALLPNGNVLVTGGVSNQNTATTSAEVFNPSTNSFSALTANMQTSRNGHTATALYNGTVLITGGWEQSPHGGAFGTDPTVLSSAEVYDPVANTFTLSSSGLTYATVEQTATLLTSGNVLIAGGFDGANNADIYTYPYTLGSLNPKFMILGVVYSPPGATSSVSYSQSTAVGTTTSLTNSVQKTTQVSATIGGKHKILGLSGSQSQTWTSESDLTSSYSVNATSADGITAKGPLSSSVGIDHDYDYVLIWLNPKLSLAQGASPQSVLWAGYTYNTNDTNVDNDMDVVQIYVSCLKNFYSAATNCTDNNYRLARSWDTSGLGGLTPADFATILAADPFGTNPAYNPITDTSHRYDPYSSINFDPAAAGSGVSCATGTFTTTTTSTAGQSASSSYTVNDSFDASLTSLLSLDFKASQSQTITNKWSTNNTQSVGDTQSYSICAPLYADNYTGPTAYSVFRDNIYDTYMFYAPNSAPSSAGTLTLSPSHLTFPQTLLGSTSAPQQVTLTYTEGPNETGNSVPLAFQSPVYTLVDGSTSGTAFTIPKANDHCTGVSLTVGQTCTFQIVYAPTGSDEATSGTLVATGLTNGLVSNAQNPITLSASTGQQLGLTAAMSSSSFSVQQGSVVSGRVNCNDTLDCTVINLLVDGHQGASTSLRDEDGNYSINITAVPAAQLTVGSHNLTVQAPGSQYWVGTSTSLTFTIIAGKASPIMTIDPPGTVNYEDPFYVSGNVNCDSACGSVSLFINGAALTTLQLDGGGNFSIQTGFFPYYNPGTYTITGEYLGNSLYNTASATPVTLTISNHED